VPKNAWLKFTAQRQGAGTRQCSRLDAGSVGVEGGDERLGAALGILDADLEVEVGASDRPVSPDTGSVARLRRWRRTRS
jgi:hypothetical protein